jgi:hypothetical protein
MTVASVPKRSSRKADEVPVIVTDTLRGPRLADVWAAVLYAVSTLLLAYPALVGRFLVNENSDQYIAGYAFRDFAGAVVVGLLGGSIQFWPVLEYTSWSPRAGGRGWDHAISCTPSPIPGSSQPRTSRVSRHAR